MSVSPLAGVLIVDLSRYLPGPYATRLLADLGARVIKVEEPGEGDPVRAAPPHRGGTSALAALLLPGQESVALDLKQPAAREVLLALLERADVLVETLRPGTLARLGLAPQELRRRFPRLVVCSLSGFGQDGPQAGRAGHDLTYQALAGLLAPTAEMPSFPAADVLGSWAVATSILAALYAREKSGEGAWIDTSMLDAAAHANVAAWAVEAGGPQPAGRRLPLTGAMACYNLYRAKDGGFVAFAPLEPRHWRRFCEDVGRRRWIARQFDRSPALRREVATLIATRTRGEWAEWFAARDFPGEPVLSAAEAAAHPQMRARGVLGRGPEGLPRLRYPARFDGARPIGKDEMPGLGEHTGAVLAEWQRPEAAQMPRTLAALGIGSKWSWRRILWRLFSR